MFTMHAIDPGHLESVRGKGTDVSGNPVEATTAQGGEPLRCCLRDATEGERLILFGFEPVLPAASPYREIGAVFAHAAPCDGPAGAGYPEGWRGRPQVLRAYDARGRIHPATRVHDGTDPEGVLADVFADAAVVRADSRNIAYGCFMFTVTRAACAGPG
ncbi:DUF1203 domain-containing protein [Dactylosporangium sp. NPDC005555]|uniref:DUF1203 domain-containing protein n=1 Tax=Dactylosporangium sp. NPDC005555 TaxID=3154889 RepID=UPI0033ADC53C